MGNLKSLLTQSPSWIFSKNKITLKAGNQDIVELLVEKSGRTTFVLENKQYSIRKQGLWNPVTLIQREGNTLLELRNKLFGNNGQAEFSNGHIYQYKIKNAPLATLSFYNNEGREFLSYKLDATVKSVSTTLVMNLQNTAMPDEELILLIISGCYSFKNIVKEYQDSDAAMLVLLVS
jgi:hypothetical protein